jgi:hypothetical protein
MKLLFDVDQRASLIHGLDAPDSTILMDVPPACIPPEQRAIIMPLYDVATGIVMPSPAPIHPRYGFRSTADGLDSVRMPAVLCNADQERALAAIAAFCAQVAAMQDRADTLKAEWEAEKTRQEHDRLEKTRQAIAGLLDGTRTIIRETNGGGVALSTGSIDSADMTGETTALLTVWRAEQAAAEEDRKALAAEKEAERKAQQINGRDWETLEVDAGTVDHFGGFDEGRLSKNWLATVSHSPASPGGLDRTFWDGRRGAREIPSNLAVGDYVESGSKDKRGRPNHTYFRVLEITKESLTVREADKPGKTPRPVEAEVAKLESLRALA